MLTEFQELIIHTKSILRAELPFTHHFFRDLRLTKPYENLSFLYFEDGAEESDPITFYESSVKNWCSHDPAADEMLRDLFLRFGIIFESGDISDQIELLDHLKEETEEMNAIYSKQAIEKGKTARSTGVLIGIGLAVVFL